MDISEDKPIKLIATYARVSDNPDDEERTIKNQLMTFTEKAGENNWQIVEEYKDDDWSGDILGRPALDRLRLDAKIKTELERQCLFTTLTVWLDVIPTKSWLWTSYGKQGLK